MKKALLMITPLLVCILGTLVAQASTIDVFLLDRNLRPVTDAVLTVDGERYVTDQQGIIQIPANLGAVTISASYASFFKEFVVEVKDASVELVWEELIQVNRPEDWNTDFAEDPRHEYTEEGYVRIVGNANYNIVLNGWYSDFILDVDVVYTDSSHIFFRVADMAVSHPNDGYSFWRHNNNMEYVRRYTGGDWNTFDFTQERFATFDFGQEVNIRIKAEGNTIAVWVNGRLWNEWEHLEGPREGEIIFRKNYSKDTPLTIKRLTILEL